MTNRYQNQKIYDPKKMTKNKTDIFFMEMVKIREEILKNFLHKDFNVVDLCCGTGAYFENIFDYTQNLIAVDNTERYLDYINKKYPNVKTILTDATDLSQITDNSIDILYCYSSLYYIKDTDKVLHEIKRILKKGGKAILEFGNKNSLNSLISKKFEQERNWAVSYPISYKKIIEILNKKLKFKIINIRHFQITSYYGYTKKYSLLNLMSHRYLQKIFCIKIKGKLLDEIISTIFPNFSFKKIVVIKK